MKKEHIIIMGLIALLMLSAKDLTREAPWEYQHITEDEMLDQVHAALKSKGLVRGSFSAADGHLPKDLIEQLKDGAFPEQAALHLESLSTEGWELAGCDGGGFWLKRTKH